MKSIFVICFFVASIAQANHYFLGYEKSATKSSFSTLFVLIFGKRI